MLQSLSNNIKGWVAGVIFTVISSTFVLWGVQYYMQSRANAEHVAADVNGQKVSLQTVNREFQQYQLREGFVSSDEMRLQVKSALLDRLINKLVQHQSAQALGFIRGSQGLVYSFMVGAFATPYEMDRLSNAVVGHNRIAYLTIPLSRFASVSEPSSAAIEAYYKSNSGSFRTPERLRCEYLQLSPKKIKESIKISDESAQEYYQANVQNYTVPRSWEVRRLVVPVPEGASQPQVEKMIKDLRSTLVGVTDLSALLKKNSRWHLVTQKVSDVNLPGALLRTLVSLRSGKLSLPVETAEGINVFKLLKYSPEAKTPYSQVSASIKKILLSQAVSERFTTLNQTLSDVTYTQPNTLKSAAKELKLKVGVSDWITLTKGSGLFSSPKLRALAFSRDVLEQKNNSQVVTLENGHSVVIRVKQRQASKLRSLDEVRGQIVKVLKRQESVVKAGQQVLAIEKQIRQGEKPAKVAAKFGLQWQQYSNQGAVTNVLLQLALVKKYNLPASDIQNVKVPDAKAPPLPVFQAAFQSPVGQLPSLGFARLSSGDAVVTFLLPPNAKSRQVKPSVKEMTRVLRQFHAETYYRIYSNKEMKKAKIKRFPQVLKSQA